MRTYIRHPTSIPIHVCANEQVESHAQVRNLSAGGLSFVTDSPIKVGSVIEFDISVIQSDYRGRGVVVWQREQMPDRYEVGVKFTSDDEYFHARMVEQVCQIEDYRQRLALQGRALSIEEAAIEWIEKYSSQFDKLSIKK